MLWNLCLFFPFWYLPFIFDISFHGLGFAYEHPCSKLFFYKDTYMESLLRPSFLTLGFLTSSFTELVSLTLLSSTSSLAFFLGGEVVRWHKTNPQVILDGSVLCKLSFYGATHFHIVVPFMVNGKNHLPCHDRATGASASMSSHLIRIPPYPVPHENLPVYPFGRTTVHHAVTVQLSRQNLPLRTSLAAEGKLLPVELFTKGPLDLAALLCTCGRHSDCSCMSL